MRPVLAVDGAKLSEDDVSIVRLAYEIDKATRSSEREASVAPLVMERRNTPTIPGLVWRGTVRPNSGNEEHLMSLSHSE